MTVTSAKIAEQVLEQGRGVLRLAPTWVARSFCTPGRRIKLHPHDYYALGGQRGGIDERWLASTVRADNGQLTGVDEGLSMAITEDGRAQVSLAEVIDQFGPDVIGTRLWEDYRGWPMYAKFFDNQGPLPLHVHHRDEHARLVGRLGKPEAYYFPPQMNNHDGDRPTTYFGLDPSTSPDELKARLAAFGRDDNRITELSIGYRLRVGTGWDVPAGVLHAPGSLCTYEPQRASDVFAMCECLSGGRMLPEELLWKDVPDDRKGDVDFVFELIDWDANVDPDFQHHHFMEPLPVPADDSATDPVVAQRWVVYRSDAFSAKEMTVPPGRTVEISEPAAFGLIAVQGHGTIGGRPIETPTVIRFGRATRDEWFVAEPAARAGVTVSNASPGEELVILAHFGPGHPDRPGVPR